MKPVAYILLPSGVRKGGLRIFKGYYLTLIAMILVVVMLVGFHSLSHYDLIQVNYIANFKQGYLHEPTFNFEHLGNSKNVTVFDFKSSSNVTNSTIIGNNTGTTNTHLQLTTLSKSSPPNHPTTATVQKANPVKRILLWTDFFHVKDKKNDFCLGKTGHERQKEMCEFQCEFTKNRKLLNSSHAVVFHGRNLDALSVIVNGTKRVSKEFVMDAPYPRNASQPWIFLLNESPTYTYLNYTNFQSVFNLTMTYRRDSDIYIPYGKVVERPPGMTYIPPMQQNKTKLVAWINSNCRLEASKRTQLVKQLRKHLEIDIYGKCGRFKCSKSNSNFCRDLLSCYKQIGKDYKFYLAFENSLCEDYVTEKVYHALATGMIPIVYGHVNYSLYLPPNSYIDVRDFNGVKELADYLLHLDLHEDEYLKYFEWRETHMIVEDHFYLERAWCSLCEKLSRQGDAPFPKKVVANLGEWWTSRNGSSVCVQPSSNNFLFKV